MFFVFFIHVTIVINMKDNLGFGTKKHKEKLAFFSLLTGSHEILSK